MIICKLRTWFRSEKIGVKFQAKVSKELFGQTEDIEPMELPLQGQKFTWNKIVSDAELDRFNWSCTTDLAALAPPLVRRLPTGANTGPPYLVAEVEACLQQHRERLGPGEGEGNRHLSRVTAVGSRHHFERKP